MAMLNLNKLHFPVTTLGPGRRIGIWLQGCSIRCPGCISVDTWEFTDEGRVDLEQVMAVIEMWLPEADGLTISGGEPFDQPEALSGLLDQFRQVGGERDVLIFSGYDYAELRENHDGLLQRIDALVSGPFVASSGNELGLRGSDNQQLRLFSERARQRFAEAEDAGERDALDVYADEQGVWFAGIPEQGDWTELEKRLAAEEVTGSYSNRREMQTS